MASTFLTHKKPGCRGNIALDTTPAVKLIAPSFSITIGGITSLVLDTQVNPHGFASMTFSCLNCGDTIPKEHFHDQLIASCQICGYDKPVGELSVHSIISTVCDDCLESIKLCIKGDTKVSDIIKEYVGAYSLKSNLKVEPLSKVLSLPINI